MLLAAAAIVLAGSIDLTTSAGANTVQAEWRYADARIVETTLWGKPTYDIAPHAGGVDFDDSAWPVITPESLIEKRGNGRVAFNWYRVNFTVPKHAAGSTLTFETSVDDYAEIWVNGEMARGDGPVVAGWNVVNKVVVARNAKPGQKIQLAIFGMNGPISNPPTNYIYVRRAMLNITPSGGPVAVPAQEINVDVVRLDPAIDNIVPPNAKVFKLAEGFEFTEGPVWVRDGGYLLFSDPNANRIYKYANGELTVFREKSGYGGADIAEYKQPGSNGLTLDRQGRLTINQHGNRRVVRMEKDGSETVLADRFDGKRLNSPNDLVYRSDGTLFFTDPPFGLPKFDADPRKEQPSNAVFARYNGVLNRVSEAFSGPNGIALSPDERYLYVGNWDDKRKVVFRYEVTSDARLINGSLFFDMTAAKGEDALDGLKVDRAGNVYVSGPGGLWILSPEGKHLGTVVTPNHVHNFAWGDDGKTLYLCARDKLYRMPLKIEGVRP